MQCYIVIPLVHTPEKCCYAVMDPSTLMSAHRFKNSMYDQFKHRPENNKNTVSAQRLTLRCAKVVEETKDSTQHWQERRCCDQSSCTSVQGQKRQLCLQYLLNFICLQDHVKHRPSKELLVPKFKMLVSVQFIISLSYYILNVSHLKLKLQLLLNRFYKIKMGHRR